MAEISITGNETFGDDELLQNLSTAEAPSQFSMGLFHVLGARVPFAKEPQYFDYQAFLDDLESLRNYYRNNGFFLAAVDGTYMLRVRRVQPIPCPPPDSPVPVLPWRRSAGLDQVEQLVAAAGSAMCSSADTAGRDEQVADVQLVIDEGPYSLIDSIAYRNISGLPPGVLREIESRPALRTGVRYRAADVQAERNRVMNILANNGFPRAYSDSVIVERRLSDNNVLVKIGFQHGRRLYFGKITEEIKGVDELNLARQIIYDQLDFRRGDVYSRALVYQGETNLNRLNIFSYVGITPEFPDIENRQDSLVPMTLELVPRKRFELAPAVIVNNQLRGISVGGEISFLMRNVFGGAQSLTTRVNVLGKLSDRLTEFTKTYLASSQLRFDQPYLFSNKNSGYIVGSYSLVAEDSLVAKGNILQLVIGAQRHFSQQLVGQASWTYEISEFTGNAKGLLEQGLVNIDTTETINFRNSIRSFSLLRDMTDDLFNPTKGFSIKGLFEEAGYLEKVGVSPLPQANEEKGIRSTEYVKLEGLARLFTDISNNGTTILGLKARLGSIFRYGRSREDNLPVPPNRRYYAGGASSIRGWSARQLAADPDAVNFGSNALLELSAEVRWNMFPEAKNWLNGLWFVSFADAGNLWTELHRISMQEMAFAFGVGLRYNLFFGPIRVDFGLKGYNPAAETDKWFFQKQNIWTDVIRKGVILLGIGHAF